MTMEVRGPNPPGPKVLNIATRTRVETGGNPLIARVSKGSSAGIALIEAYNLGQ